MDILTDTETLARLIQEATERALRDQLPPLVREATRKSWLTKDEVRSLTGWSERTLQHLRDSRQIPFAQHGRKILYPTAGIEAFLAKHRVLPNRAKHDSQEGR